MRDYILPSVLCVIATVISGGLAKAEDLRDRENPIPEHRYSEAHQFVFFAVLEGCYRDGLTNAEIDLIIPPSEDNPAFRDMSVNMVITCPLCSPAFDAFNLYAERSRFVRQPKIAGGYNTFGPGVTPAIRAELAKPGKPCRDALQEMIQKWVDVRIKQQRLNKKAIKELRAELKKMREEGEEALKRFKAGGNGDELLARYKDWGDECPVCSGASPMGGKRKLDN